MSNKKIVRLSHPIKTTPYGTSNGDQNRLILIDGSKNDGGMMMGQNNIIYGCKRMTQLLIVLYAYLYMGFQQRQGPQEIRHNGSREVSI